MGIQVSLSPEEIDQISKKVTEQVISELQEVIPGRFQKRAYTPAEVADLIGYSKRTVLAFIREGRVGRKGQNVKLENIEITFGEYRITPEQLDQFLAQF